MGKFLADVLSKSAMSFKDIHDIQLEDLSGLPSFDMMGVKDDIASPSRMEVQSEIVRVVN